MNRKPELDDVYSNILNNLYSKDIAEWDTQCQQTLNYLKENPQLHAAVKGRSGFSKQYLIILELILLCSNNSNPVYLIDEDGFNKDFIASAIHTLSNRGKKPLYQISLSTEPEQEIQLFGKTNKGLLKIANGSSLFIDNIENMTLECQLKLNSALHSEKEYIQYYPIGSTQIIKSNVRFIFANKKPLSELDVALINHQNDLFYDTSYENNSKRIFKTNEWIDLILSSPNKVQLRTKYLQQLEQFKELAEQGMVPIINDELHQKMQNIFIHVPPLYQRPLDAIAITIDQMMQAGLQYESDNILQIAELSLNGGEIQIIKHFDRIKALGYDKSTNYINYLKIGKEFKLPKNFEHNHKEYKEKAIEIIQNHITEYSNLCTQLKPVKPRRDQVNRKYWQDPKNIKMLKSMFKKTRENTNTDLEAFEIVANLLQSEYPHINFTVHSVKSAFARTLD